MFPGQPLKYVYEGDVLPKMMCIRRSDTYTD